MGKTLAKKVAHLVAMATKGTGVDLLMTMATKGTVGRKATGVDLLMTMATKGTHLLADVAGMANPQ